MVLFSSVVIVKVHLCSQSQIGNHWIIYDSMLLVQVPDLQFWWKYNLSQFEVLPPCGRFASKLQVGHGVWMVSWFRGSWVICLFSCGCRGSSCSVRALGTSHRFTAGAGWPKLSLSRFSFSPGSSLGTAVCLLVLKKMQPAGRSEDWSGKRDRKAGELSFPWPLVTDVPAWCLCFAVTLLGHRLSIIKKPRLSTIERNTNIFQVVNVPAAWSTFICSNPGIWK